MDAAAKKDLLRRLPFGMFAVTVAEGETQNAFTANWLTQAAFDPPMIMVAVENEGRSIGMIRATGTFAVNLLGEDQRELAGQLGRSYARNPHKLDGVPHHPAPNGSPILNGALGWLACRVTGELPTGDHTVFVAEITDAGILREGALLTMAAAGFRYSG
jgi:flavin reductase (DIM6/NTAB) family NADH-FMN oxidoreductase RutF